MSILATGWEECQAGELWGHVSAPLLCTQGVALGGAPVPLLSIAREAPGDRTQKLPHMNENHDVSCKLNYVSFLI